jgi:hypothetical protein
VLGLCNQHRAYLFDKGLIAVLVAEIAVAEVIDQVVEADRESFPE